MEDKKHIEYQNIMRNEIKIYIDDIHKALENPIEIFDDHGEYKITDEFNKNVIEMLKSME